jgi:hypothetical protein
MAGGFLFYLLWSIAIALPTILKSSIALFLRSRSTFLKLKIDAIALPTIFKSSIALFLRLRSTFLKLKIDAIARSPILLTFKVMLQPWINIQKTWRSILLIWIVYAIARSAIQKTSINIQTILRSTFLIVVVYAIAPSPIL